MEKFKIGKEVICFYGKSRGANSNKFNRVNKLAAMYNPLSKKLHEMAKRGMKSCSPIYRGAVATLLLLETGIRIGNESSAEGYNTVPHPHNKDQSTKFVKTYGLTTLLREHVVISRGKHKVVSFNFVGKKQVANEFVIPRELVDYVVSIAQCNEDPIFGITDYELTKFIKRYVGKCFSPKDFRTLRANIYAYQSIVYSKPDIMNMTTKKEAKEITKRICIEVSEQLNNTPGVCKKSYIDDNLFIENLSL